MSVKKLQRNFHSARFPAQRETTLPCIISGADGRAILNSPKQMQSKLRTSALAGRY